MTQYMGSSVAYELSSFNVEMRSRRLTINFAQEESLDQIELGVRGIREGVADRGVMVQLNQREGEREVWETLGKYIHNGIVKRGVALKLPTAMYNDATAHLKGGGLGPHV